MKILTLGLIALFALIVLGVIMPTQISLAQATATRTPTVTASSTPTLSGTRVTGSATAAVTATVTLVGNTVKDVLEKEGYVVISSGAWYDEAGKPNFLTAHVFMFGAGSDVKSAASVTQIRDGFAALRASFPAVVVYHVLLLNGANIYDASASATELQQLNATGTPTALVPVLNRVRVVNLVNGAVTTGGTATPTPLGTSQAAATAAPTVVPTKAPAPCTASTDQARVWAKNGYSGVIKITIGGGDWGTHDYNIPADGQYHYIDMPPGRYTYTASLPGFAALTGAAQDYRAGQCYYLTFSP